MVDAIDAERSRETPSEHTDDTTSAPRLRETWLLHKPQLLQLLLAYVLLTAVWVGLGKLLTGPLKDGRIVDADLRVAEDLAADRTARWDDLTAVGTLLADTIVKIVATAIIAAVMLAD